MMRLRQPRTENRCGGAGQRRNRVEVGSETEKRNTRPMVVIYLAIVRKEILALYRTCAKSNTEVINKTTIIQTDMEILPKHKIGDKLWTVEKCKARSFVVTAIITTTTEAGTNISYTNGSVYNGVAENECFASKEDLIAQL